MPESTARQNSGDYDSTYYNSTRADGDILRTAFGLDGRNLNRRGPIPELDEVLTDQLAATDTAARAELIRHRTAAGARQRSVDPDGRAVTGHRRRPERAGPEVRGLGATAVLRHLAERSRS